MKDDKHATQERRRARVESQKQQDAVDEAR